MSDLTLFELTPTGRARRSDPSTSKAAARKTDATTMRSQILAAFAAHGTLTDDECCLVLDLPVRRWPTCKTARSALTHCDPPKLQWTGIVRNGQNVWSLAPAWPGRTVTVDTNGRT